MARGAKKPNNRLSAVTQLFYYGYFVFTPSSGRKFQQGETIDSMRSIREDIFSTAYASYMVELLDRSVDDRKANPFLFELLYQSLHYINEGYDAEILKFIFEMKMLQVNGLVLHLVNVPIAAIVKVSSLFNS